VVDEVPSADPIGIPANPHSAETDQLDDQRTWPGGIPVETTASGDASGRPYYPGIGEQTPQQEGSASGALDNRLEGSFPSMQFTAIRDYGTQRYDGRYNSQWEEKQDFINETGGLSPYVGHFQGFGKSSEGVWDYTTESKYRGGEERSYFGRGTTNGGVWFTPPENMIDGDYSGSLSTSYFSFYDTVRFGWGTPNSSGILTDSTEWRVDRGAQTILLSNYDSSGVVIAAGAANDIAYTINGDITAYNVIATGPTAGHWSRTGTVITPNTAGDTVQFSAGTESVPGWSFAGDADTGAYLKGANNLSLVTAGVDRIRVESNGDVYIGADTDFFFDISREDLTIGSSSDPGNILIPGSGGGRAQQGFGGDADGSESLVLGDGSADGGNAQCTLIGSAIEVFGFGSTAVGYTAKCGSSNGTSLGWFADASGAQSVALGYDSDSVGVGSVAIGYLATTSHQGSIALGRDSVTTATNQLYLGDNADTAYAIKKITWAFGELDFEHTATDQLTITADDKTVLTGDLDLPTDFIIFENGTGFFHTTNTDNIFCGDPISGLTTGVANATYAVSAGSSLTSGYFNAFFGNGAGQDATTAQSNACFGFIAGTNLIGGSFNTFIGRSAGTAATSGYRNATIGVFSGAVITSGYNNVCIGDTAGVSLTTGHHNICVGTLSAPPSGAAATYEMQIGNFFFGLTGDSIANAKVGIGTNAPTVTGLTLADANKLAWLTDSSIERSAANQLTITASDKAIISNDLTVNNDAQVDSLGVGVAADGTTAHLLVGAAGSGQISVPGAGANSEQFGVLAVASGTSSTAVGNSAEATAHSTIAIGNSADATATSAISIGTSSNATALHAVVVGFEANAIQTYAIAMGSTAAANNPYSIAIGQATDVSHTYSIAMGKGATTTAQKQLMLGNTNSSQGIGSIVWGYGELSFTRSAANQLTITADDETVFTGDVDIEGNVLNLNNTGTPSTTSVMYFTGGNSGEIGWSVINDRFTFADDVLMDSAEKLYFRDTAAYLNSPSTGNLDFVTTAAAGDFTFRNENATPSGVDIVLDAKNGAGTVKNFGKFTNLILDSTAGSEDSTIDILTQVAGGLATAFRAGSGGVRWFGENTGGTADFGDATNYTTFADDGYQTMAGTARVKKTKPLGAGASLPGATAPANAVVGITPVLQFSQNPPVESSYFVGKVPDDWEAGTNVTVHIHWAPATAAAGDVRWELELTSLASDANEVLTAAATTGGVTDSTQTLQDELLKTATITFSGSVFSADDVISLRLYRDTASELDTYEAAANFVNLHFEYTANKLGEAL
jgi:hypothetical protein